jgi:hypothetical protein
VEAGTDEPQSRSRHARRREPPRRDEPVDVLVPLEHADEQRGGPLRERRRRRRGERREVGVSREHGGGLDAVVARERDGEVRQRTDGVCPPQRPRREPVGDCAERAAGLRAVEARRGAPVAVELDHELRRDPRQPSCGEHRQALERALDEDDLRPEVA